MPWCMSSVNSLQQWRETVQYLNLLWTHETCDAKCDMATRLTPRNIFTKNLLYKWLLIYIGASWSKACCPIVIRAKSRINLLKWPTCATLTEFKCLVSAWNYKTNAFYFVQIGSIEAEDWLCKVPSQKEIEIQHMKLRHCSYITQS